MSHHLRQLRITGLADSRRQGKLVIYRLTDIGRQVLVAVTKPGTVDAAQPAAVR